MRRPQVWLRALLLVGLLCLLAESAALTWLAPRHVLQAVQRVVGSELTIREARLSFPFTTKLLGVRSASRAPEATLSIQRIIAKPRWLSVAPRILRVDTLEIERPFLRLMRTKAGTVLWPHLPSAVMGSASAEAPAAAPAPTVDSLWQVHIESVHIVDGTIEFSDERIATPFHGVVDHLSVVIGPVTIPLHDVQTSFAVRGEVVGHAGHGAPLYCSGWLDRAAKGLEISCQLEPLALAAFDPYFHGSPEVRVYTTTIAATGRWSASANELSGRLQLILDHISQGDLSVHGRTIVDVKRITGGHASPITREVSMSGPLDNPSAWAMELVPSDDWAQSLVERLIEYGVTVVKIPFGNSHQLHVSLTSPSTKATRAEVEAASKEISEALELLALPVPSEVPVTVSPVMGEEAATPPVPVEATDATPLPPVEQQPLEISESARPLSSQ